MKARTHPLSLWNIPYAQAHWEGRGHIGRIREITHEGWEDSHNSGADVWASEPCAEVGPGAQWVWEGSAGCLSRGAPAIHLLLRHLSVSGKAACVIYRAVSRTYRHHGLGEHKYSSTMKNKVGVSQVITGRPGRGQREDRSLLSGAMFVQDTAVSLPDLLAACGPRKYSPPSWNGLSLWNSKHHRKKLALPSSPLRFIPGLPCYLLSAPHHPLLSPPFSFSLFETTGLYAFTVPIQFCMHMFHCLFIVFTSGFYFYFMLFIKLLISLDYIKTPSLFLVFPSLSSTMEIHSLEQLSAQSWSWKM